IQEILEQIFAPWLREEQVSLRLNASRALQQGLYGVRQIGHCGDHDVCAGHLKLLSELSGRMGCTGKTNRLHARGNRSSNAKRRILKDNTVAGCHCERAGWEQVKIGRGLALLDLVRGEDTIPNRPTRPVTSSERLSRCRAEDDTTQREYGSRPSAS